MDISIIVAIAQNNVIGRDNQLPWHIPNDLKHFKELTMGKPMLMGRKTFESIGRALPGRRNLILTRDKNFKAQGCEIYHSVEDALASIGDGEELMVIGGEQLFKGLLPHANRLYLTFIHDDIEGDTYFPEWDQSEWKEVMRQDFHKTKEVPFSYSFVSFERN